MEKGIYRGCEEWLERGLHTLKQDMAGRAENPVSKSRRQGGVRRSLKKSGRLSLAAFHKTILQGDFTGATALCQKFSAAQPDGVATVYRDLLLPTIAQLGRDWSDDLASFDQIAFGYSLIHHLIELLGREDEHRNSSAKDLCLGHVIVAVAPLDTHNFGARIVANQLQLQGWGVTYADGPRVKDVEALLAQGGVDALAISVNTDAALMGLADQIAQWRSVTGSRDCDIIVGGASIMPPAANYDFLRADAVGLSLDGLSHYLRQQVVTGRYGKRLVS